MLSIAPSKSASVAINVGWNANASLNDRCLDLSLNQPGICRVDIYYVYVRQKSIAFSMTDVIYRLCSL